jgi:hypothetical protein
MIRQIQRRFKQGCTLWKCWISLHCLGGELNFWCLLMWLSATYTGHILKFLNMYIRLNSKHKLPDTMQHKQSWLMILVNHFQPQMDGKLVRIYILFQRPATG